MTAPKAAPRKMAGRQSADKAHNRKNRPDIQKIRSDFCFLRQLHLHPAVTYVYVSSLGCKIASLSCRLSYPSGTLFASLTSWGHDNSTVARLVSLPEYCRYSILLLGPVAHTAVGHPLFR